MLDEDVAFSPVFAIFEIGLGALELALWVMV